MHKFKKALAVLIASAFVFALAGCGKSKETTKKEKTQTKTEEKEKDESSKAESEESEIIKDLSSFDAAMEGLSQDFAGYLENKLGITSAKIKEDDPAKLTRELAFSGKYYMLTDKEEPRLECLVYDSEKEALNAFMDIYYNPFNETFQKDQFLGGYKCVLEDGHGYIVVDGSDLGTSIFGDRYRSGNKIYAGIYYEGSTIVIIMPKNDVSNDRIEEVIKLLGLPAADGENT